MSEWISVEDRLPESEKEVMFYFDQRCHVGYFIERAFGTNKFMWWSAEYNCVHNVKFWMPLPKPPGVKDET